MDRTDVEVHYAMGVRDPCTCCGRGGSIGWKRFETWPEDGRRMGFWTWVPEPQYEADRLLLAAVESP